MLRRISESSGMRRVEDPMAQVVERRRGEAKRAPSMRRGVDEREGGLSMPRRRR